MKYKAADTLLDLKAAALDIDEEDWVVFQRLTCMTLSPQELNKAAQPDKTDPGACEFLAVHWHPEWTPLELIEARVRRAFPNADNSLLIPTQHNQILSLGEWSGVEADVFDHHYNAKIHLLIHMKTEVLAQASAFAAMMERTYNYRALQLIEILDRLIEPEKLSIKPALASTIPPEAVQMARFFAARLKNIIGHSGVIGTPRREMLKNRLLPDFISLRASKEDQTLLAGANLYIEAVKKSVKAEIKAEQFYSPQEIIEEARHLGGGVVIPHPPAFWPVLVSGLDVDGWEVWNSSTPNHCLFLIEALARANSGRKKKILAFMGDDTHMSSKLRHSMVDSEKSAREIGFQAPWQDQEVRALLKKTGQSLSNTINEYRARLS